MAEFDLRTARIRMPKAAYDAMLAKAKAERRRADNEDQRPATPSGLDGGEGDVIGDPEAVIRHMVELLRDGNAGKALELGEGHLKTPARSEPEQVAAKALLAASKAIADLEGIRRRISADKDILRFVNSSVRQASPARRLLRSIDRAVQEGP